MQSNEGKKIIKNYNKLAEVLVAFELLYHRAWERQVVAAKSGLKASLLVRHPETKELFVNLDPDILTLVRETEVMSRLGMEIPAGAQMLRAKQSAIKENYNQLSVSYPLLFQYINQLSLFSLSWFKGTHGNQ